MSGLKQERSLKDIRIVFMGTPEFSVPTLQKLVEEGLNVVGVVTGPDKPAGRGMQLQKSAVKQYAESAGLPVLQPEKLRDPRFLEALDVLNADLQVVVAFRMLPEVVWSKPPLGTINLHSSLLPQYRGAAPINWAVINGEKLSGLTTFKLQHAIDTGNILLQIEMPVAADEDAGSLHDRMMLAGGDLVLKTIEGLVAGTLQGKPQSETTELKTAPKIFKETCQIDFNKTTAEVFNLIRGLSPFPTAFTLLDGKMLKIYKAHPQIPAATDKDPFPETGALITDGKTFIKYRCSDGFIVMDELQLAGKKKMTTPEFLRGYHFNN
ncbi:methionyl-tRNA formyltransferase [Arachidicoccus rhizosphaerae]|jgi:methionyl-tRNA formyltransferase|uniref:Methionyl-tRNA formyltransferase n=1 Tax=Arachidicoccus rhizosphaerae TaxID=551991 RepID=A0A1H4AUE5_9BACT|nr:methionyl-tRNA formyltransferase [Arachidicoccus rhizosphaerae]SEA39539.1 methionyl-tRNA formyltransferase [Arachidicoccus rhizosphaerae]